MAHTYQISQQVFAGNTGTVGFHIPNINSAVFATALNNDDTLVRSSLEGSIRIRVSTDDPSVDLPTPGWWLNLIGSFGLWHDGGRGLTPRTPPFSPITDPDPTPNWLNSTRLQWKPYNMFEGVSPEYSYGVIGEVKAEDRWSHAMRKNETEDLALAPVVWACYSFFDDLFPNPPHIGPPTYVAGIDLYARTWWRTIH
jgi:hypothetical protein